MDAKLVAAEALAWASKLRGALRDEKALARAEVLAAEQYDLAEYVSQIELHNMAIAVLRAVGQAIRTGNIPAAWGQDNKAERNLLISTGLKKYDPRVAFQASLRTAYAAGREARIDRSPDLEYKLYRTMRDERVRDSHKVYDGLVLPKTDKVWDTLTAPNGWRCRCRCYGLSREGVEKLEARGLTLKKALPEEAWVEVPTADGGTERQLVGIEKGFDNKPGSAENERVLKELLKTRAKKLQDEDF